MVLMNLYVGQQQRCRQEGEGGMNLGSSTKTYTLPYVKEIASGTLLAGTGSSTGAL